MFTSAELLGWLQEKLVEAEKSLNARNEMAATWGRGTNKSWQAVGCKLTKTERLTESAMHQRISKKCEREVQIIKALIERIQLCSNPVTK